MAGKKEAKTYFISHDQGDVSWAKWIAKTLKAEGHSVILTGDTPAVPTDAVLIALLSKAYLSSETGKAEWISAYSRDKTGAERAIIPVRVENVLPEGLLSHRVFIDIFGNISDEERTKRLLAGLSDEIRELQESEYQDSDNAIWKEGFTSHNLPPREAPRNSSHTAILSEIEGYFSAAGDTNPVLILAGSAGAGKTAIALDYARQNLKKYHTVWLVNAEDQDSLDLSYQQLAQAKKIAAATGDTGEAVRDWLENDAGYLIIFDHVEDMNLLDNYLPQEVHGHILMTCRDMGAAAILMLENIPIPVNS